MKEQTFIITDDKSNTIINTREECKIESKHSYRVGENIQSSGYTHTHTSKTIKKGNTIGTNHTRQGYAQQLSIER